MLTRISAFLDFSRIIPRVWSEEWPSGYSAELPIQGSRVQNHQVAPSSTQPSILSRSIKWAPVISGNLVAKCKLPPRGGSSFEVVERHPLKRDHKVLFFWNTNFLIIFFWNFSKFVPTKFQDICTQLRKIGLSIFTKNLHHRCLLGFSIRLCFLKTLQTINFFELLYIIRLLNSVTLLLLIHQPFC